MDKVIRKAARGWRKEMTYLYEANKQKVYYVAGKLLLDEAKAAEAVQWVFENIWGSMTKQEVSKEADFTQLAMKLTAAYCKKQVEEVKPDAFSSSWKSETVIEAGGSASEGKKDCIDAVLTNLSELQRFVLVLHNVGGLNKMKLAIMLKVEHYTVQKILTTAEQVVEALVENKVVGDDWSYSKLTEVLVAEAKDAKVPESADAAVTAVIDKIAAKTEKKDKKLDNIFSVLLLVVGVIALAGIFFGDDIKTAIWGETIIEETSTEGSMESGTLTSTDNAGNAAESTEPEATVEEIAAGLGLTLLDENLTYYVDLEIQDYGKIVIELNQEEAPITTANFVGLAESGFYNGLTFHRILKGYMMQGGDPYGNGTGGSGNPIVGEFKDNGYDNDLSHTRGAVSMARSGEYDSASSQFFIVQEDYPFWNGYYAVFGYVTEGMEIVDAICEAAEPKDANGTIAADKQPVNKLLI